MFASIIGGTATRLGPPRSRWPLAALLAALLPLVAGCQPRFGGTPPEQGWSAAERAAWYRGTQGSRLLPRTWFDALEVAAGEAPFGAPGHLASFGFLAPPAGHDATLPIGFTLDRQADGHLDVGGLRWYAAQPGGDTDAEPWIGLNCSACHTARIDYRGVSTIVDGGPNLLDFQGFVEALDGALAATGADPDKWERFAARVLEGRDTAANRARLEGAFERLLSWQRLTARMNATPLRYGAGRLDAVGHIYNKVLMFNGAGAGDGNAADAPVSYPFLWDIWRQRRVQWNGIAENSRLRTPGDPVEYGALGRNAGEVLGVFGEVLVVPNTGLADTVRGYRSTVRSRNLMRMEQILQRLEAPRWPAHFPSVDASLAEAGRALFARDCVGCHLTPERQVEGEPTERMVAFEDTAPENLTDIWMACNAFVHAGPSGPLQGTEDNDGRRIGERAPVANMLATVVKGTLVAEAPDILREGALNFFAVRRLPGVDRADPFDPRGSDRALCLQSRNVPILGYKARPLDGIWATAPYLHNGSVRTLHELLLPAAERAVTFRVGSREYDPRDVGYVDDPDAGFLLDTRLEGNRNVGHEYGVGALDEADRRALVEYLKTL